ncbi:uncharacterized protein [Physcomitrium patens]|uniref:uncharacterized protein isoform X2 n=1 Tax=Physcomitrium patens TaxID=3218 RepID=UPI003CCCAE95
MGDRTSSRWPASACGILWVRTWGRGDRERERERDVCEFLRFAKLRSVAASGAKAGGSKRGLRADNLRGFFYLRSPLGPTMPCKWIVVFERHPHLSALRQFETWKEKCRSSPLRGRLAYHRPISSKYFGVVTQSTQNCSHHRHSPFSFLRSSLVHKHELRTDWRWINTLL